MRSKGAGNITPSGYIRIKVNGKLHMQHRYVWVKRHGEIPKGHEIHHRNGDKQDNRLCNLKLVTRFEHRRMHEGWHYANRKWYKKCKDCMRVKQVNSSNWHFTSKNSPAYGNCKDCYNQSRRVNEISRTSKVASRPLIVNA